MSKARDSTLPLVAVGAVAVSAAASYCLFKLQDSFSFFADSSLSAKTSDAPSLAGSDSDSSLTDDSMTEELIAPSEEQPRQLLLNESEQDVMPSSIETTVENEENNKTDHNETDSSTTAVVQTQRKNRGTTKSGILWSLLLTMTLFWIASYRNAALKSMADESEQLLAEPDTIVDTTTDLAKAALGVFGHA